jgi:hypothetical protein
MAWKIKSSSHLGISKDFLNKIPKLLTIKKDSKQCKKNCHFFSVEKNERAKNILNVFSYMYYIKSI